MKTFNKLISFAIISMTSLTYTACSDGFFDRYPTDSMQMETYLKNDAELQNILLNGYYHLQDITLNVNYVNSLATDEGYDYKKNNSLDHISLNESTWDATLGITSEIWEHCFNMINRCNNVLQKLDNASETNRTQYEGEAKFLRAYAYFTYMDFPAQVQRCIYTTNWIERLNRKYRRTIQMRTSMPSEKSVIFLLAAVAMEETKTTYERRIYQFKNWKEKNKITVEVQRKER